MSDEQPVVCPQVIDIRLVRRTDGAWVVRVDGRGGAVLTAACPGGALSLLAQLTHSLSDLFGRSEADVLANVIPDATAPDRATNALLDRMFGAAGPPTAADVALDSTPDARKA